MKRLILLLLIFGSSVYAVDTLYFNFYDLLERENTSEALNLIPELKKEGIDKKDRLGRTPLWHAIRWMNNCVAEKLIESGSDILITDDTNNTLLHLAVIVENSYIT